MTKSTQKKSNTKKKNSAKRKGGDTYEKPILPYLLIGLAITLLIIAAVEIDAYLERNSIDHVDTTCDFCHTATASISSTTKLKDLNDIHLRHAKKNGLAKPFKTNNDFLAVVDSLNQAGVLIKISESKYCHVPRLTHSFPYLTPEAANLLQEIGIRFQIKLHEHNLPKYKFEVSSLLRTEESQKRLSKVNYQATRNESAHYYGTTFDISYSRYKRFGLTVQDAKLEQLLTETLCDLRSECRLLCVNEKRNKCYHITVVKCKND